MRSIKFRAWDYTTDVMLKEGQVYIQSDGHLWISRIEKSMSRALKSEIELMQYTGLKDKNGVEIYEGDIVEIRGNKITTDFICKIIFEDGSFGRKTEFSFIPLCQWTLLNDCEVIGNVYEHPHLLEVKDA